MKLCANYLAAKTGDIPTLLRAEYRYWQQLIEAHGVEELKRIVDHCCDNYETSYEWPKITVSVIMYWSMFRYVHKLPRSVYRKMLINRRLEILSKAGDYTALADKARRHHVSADEIEPWTLPDDIFARLVADGSIRAGSAKQVVPAVSSRGSRSSEGRYRHAEDA